MQAIHVQRRSVSPIIDNFCVCSARCNSTKFAARLWTSSLIVIEYYNSHRVSWQIAASSLNIVISGNLLISLRYRRFDYTHVPLIWLQAARETTFTLTALECSDAAWHHILPLSTIKLSLHTWQNSRCSLAITKQWTSMLVALCPTPLVSTKLTT